MGRWEHCGGSGGCGGGRRDSGGSGFSGCVLATAVAWGGGDAGDLRWRWCCCWW